jgi:hypothetical protein
MKPQLLDIGSRDGVVGGTFFSVFSALHSADIVQAVVMGVIGTGVSFLTSMGLRWMVGAVRKLIG